MLKKDFKGMQGTKRSVITLFLTCTITYALRAIVAMAVGRYKSIVSSYFTRQLLYTLSFPIFDLPPILALLIFHYKTYGNTVVKMKETSDHYDALN